MVLYLGRYRPETMEAIMDKSEVLLESYALQKDLRIRLPKQILSNMPVDIGTVFNIYFNPVTNEIILRAASLTPAANKGGVGEEI